LNSLVQKKTSFVRHEPCPECRANGNDSKGNNISRYSDGSAYCFACTHYQGPRIVSLTPTKVKKRMNFIEGEYKDLAKRRLSSETLQKFHYQISKDAHIANYYNKENELVAQHIRKPNKDFKWIGSVDNLQLFGQHLWRDGGKLCVVTEGEIDSMSVSQYVFQNRFPVVSIPSGVQSASKYIAQNIEWLELFDHVVFCFDNDKQGREAAIKCAALLTPSKAKIASLPLKDASDMIQAGKSKDLVDCIYGAKIYRPDGIIQGKETWDLLIEEDKDSTSNYPYVGLNEKLNGLRTGEIVTFTAGTGIGKSQVCKEIAYHLTQNNQQVAYIALEENVKRSIRSIVGLELNKPIHLPEVFDSIEKEELKEAWSKVSSNIHFYNHFGSTDSNNLLSKIKYFVTALGCKWVVLDHISIVVSGIADGDERRIIDNTMTKLRSLVEELQFGLILVCHLKRPVNVNKGHEEGLSTSMSQLKGSSGVGQLTDICIGCERNQQSTEHPNLMTLRILKNRFNGTTGIATYLNYNPETNRLLENNYEFD